MTIHAMIDLETLDVSPTAQVLSIGGVKFNPNSKEEPFDEFFYRVDINYQDSTGRTVSEETLSWWATQDADAIENAFSEEDRVSPQEMLRHLKKWYVGCDTVWSQRILMDIGIVQNMCKQYDSPVPWPYWAIKDSATLFGILPDDPRKAYQFLKHDPLQDAKFQAKSVQDAISNLGLIIK